jgi:transposase InsO family protein
VVSARDVREKKGPETVSRTAEEPGQTINVDLCFVPAIHEVASKLPAVSGSSGRLVVEPLPTETTEIDYPGRIFADETLDYAEAMHQFVVRSQAKLEMPSPEMSQAEGEETDVRAQKRAWRRQAENLRLQRRQLREQRQQEDQAWQQLQAQRRAQAEARAIDQPQGERRPWGHKKAQDEPWRQLRQQRNATREQRQQEDDLWRQQRQALHQQALSLPLVSTWIAILVMTDNCTRQCLSLPLFVAGAHVTAEMVVDALQTLLPPDLQFLISDRGSHFTARVFEQLFQDTEFIHVLIARHRPQSNGIAERFVRSLKEWLRPKSWSTVEELGQLLAQFRAEYNDRPHQGLPIPGLSPNEFAQRIWLL